MKSVVNLSREDLLRAVDEGKRAAWAKLSAIQVRPTGWFNWVAVTVSNGFWAKLSAIQVCAPCLLCSQEL